jgi:hypothetical protein
MNRLCLSILMPICKGGRFIARTIESVLAQSYPDIDLIYDDYDLWLRIAAHMHLRLFLKNYYEKHLDWRIGT